MSDVENNFECYISNKTGAVDWEAAVNELTDNEFEELIRRGVELNPFKGSLPICQTIISGEDTKFFILLSHGANPFIRDNLPLVHAIMINNLVITRKLSELGANLIDTLPTKRIIDNTYGNYMDTYYMYTKDYNNYQGYMLMYLIRNGWIDMLKLLMEYQTDMTYDNYFPLKICVSCREDHIPVITKMLIEYQLPPNNILQELYIKSIYRSNFVVSQIFESLICHDDNMVSDILKYQPFEKTT